jgi:hypothetical protein
MTLDALAEWHDRMAEIEHDEQMMIFHRNAAQHCRDVDAMLAKLSIGPDLGLSIGPPSD